ncbi:endonuclease I family protein [Bdellovibrio sp. HCB-162]|uniref:endonuclease I family protein n=1 Tax=Bdellovibrio sp. HCB-162 TaxID=3394234 RepID=UPI0039BC6898
MNVLMLTLVVLFSANFGHAAPASQEVPYYGEKFYNDLASGISNNDLKNSIKLVLRSYHLRVNGGLDQIVNNCSGSNCYAQTSIGYNGARVYLMGKFYLHDNGGGNYSVTDVYCDNEKTAADFRGGNAPAPNRIPDSNVINVEHTWPQSRFSGKFDKGTQKADLHHLFPTDSKLNSVRGNNNFGEVVKDTKTLGCPASRFGTPDGGGKEIFEPPHNHKGNVARALFYFSLRYDLPINASEEAFLRKWAKEDPIDDEEIRRNDDIYQTQGNRNPFIDFPNLQDNIADF